LGEKLHDQRFLRLLQSLLQAGYLEDWRYHATISGSPQGGGVSPILANTYLDQLDHYVEQTLVPAYTRGNQRKANPAYDRLIYQGRKAHQEGKLVEAKQLLQQAQQLPRCDPQDPAYRRLRYIRYADDVLLGFAGPKSEAEIIKQHLTEFLHSQLDLELSQEKTLITHACTQAAHFLGYEIVVHLANSWHDQNGRRSLNGSIGLRLPLQVLHDKCALFQSQRHIRHRPELLQDDDFSIMTQYQAEYRGVVQYYLLAENVAWLSKLRWVMQGSLLRTLACKHRTSQRKIKQKYQNMVDTPTGKMKCLEIKVPREGKKKPLVARFGGIPLRHQKHAILNDQQPLHYVASRAEILKRFLAKRCELCGKEGYCEVHHVRKLADLKMKGRKEKPLWVQLMASRQRKTLVVCHNCHCAIHAGRLQSPPS
jgi:hypothetical protein